MSCCGFGFSKKFAGIRLIAYSCNKGARTYVFVCMCACVLQAVGSAPGIVLNCLLLFLGRRRRRRCLVAATIYNFCTATKNVVDYCCLLTRPQTLVATTCRRPLSMAAPCCQCLLNFHSISITNENKPKTLCLCGFVVAAAVGAVVVNSIFSSCLRLYACVCCLFVVFKTLLAFLFVCCLCLQLRFTVVYYCLIWHPSALPFYALFICFTLNIKISQSRNSNAQLSFTFNISPFRVPHYNCCHPNISG